MLGKEEEEAREPKHYSGGSGNNYSWITSWDTKLTQKFHFFGAWVVLTRHLKLGGLRFWDVGAEELCMGCSTGTC